MAQQEIGFVEEFALAPNREDALKQLIPGTEDYYYYHALHYQNTGQRDKLDEMLAQWEKRFPSSGPRGQIVNRQALIDYTSDPKGSLEHIRRALGLNFNHQQEGKSQARIHPSALDQAEISWEKFLADALAGVGNLQRLDDRAFFPLLASGRDLSDEQRRDLLSRADLPDLPGIVGLVVADLNSKESRGFGEFDIHRALTMAQLEELLALKGDLIRNENYVHTYLAKLLPGADENPAADPAERQAYLDRAWAFVQGLEPAFNSLKAHVLYQRLVFDRSQGRPDAARFMEYLKLPREAFYVRPEWRRDQQEAWRFAADTNRDYRDVTGMPPIGGDEPLVREYLLHFLRDAENADAYAPYIEEGYLKAVFAETKIVNGIGDPEQWASLLSPSAFQELKDRVDIDFDPTSPDEFAIGDPVKLKLHVKNVETLIVKVFEVNTLNYYLDRGAEVSTDLNLDGLVPNHERTIEYQEAPARRIAREFEFPEIGASRGVWVVEFIGGSRSSRAVIRKGRLGALTTTVSGGEGITVIDEAHQPVPGAAVWFGGRRFACDDQGRALIPFSTDPGARAAVLEDAGGFATLFQFAHPAENYALNAGVYVDREALRPGALATIVIRPTLTVAGQPIPFRSLTDARLTLTSVNLDGVSATTTIPGIELLPDRETTHEFRVPDRLASLTVLVQGKVKVASQGGQEIDMAAGETFEVNDQLRSERVDDLYLSRIGGGFVAEFLGRTGEPRAAQNLVVTLRRTGFQNTRSFTLRTDAEAGIALGALDGIEWLSVKAPDGHERAWNLPQARRTQPGIIHATAGEPVRVPFFGSLDRAQVALFAQSNGGYVADAFDSLSLMNGMLVATDLAPGDYKLLLKRSGQSVTILVAEGETTLGHVFNDARSLELPRRAPAHLAAVSAGDEALEIRVANADALTRVHVIATRFLPDFDLFAAVGNAPRPGLFNGRPGRLPNLYLSGRKIGDEFRYILERRYAQKLPGNMLERPEILLNPWAVRDTAAETESLAEGEDFGRADPGMDAAGGRLGGGGAGGGGAAAGGSPRTIDFLKNAPASIINLQPDEDGRITVQLDAFGDRQHVHVVVVDPDGASIQEVALPDRATAIGDLRLLAALDPERHFTEQDSVTLLKAGDKLEIPDILTARFEVFDQLGAAYRYLLALRDDATLREFGFILDWPDLKPEEKRAHFSKHACHELSFFLAMKDPEFFKTEILPYLANKKDKTFLDDYLLGADLAAYFAPYEYSRLNAPERILLARRTPGRLDGIRLDLRDRLALAPPDLGRDNLMFEGALATFGMNRDRNRAIDEAKVELTGQLVERAESAGEDAPAAATAVPAPSGGAPATPQSNAAPALRKSLARRAGALAEVDDSEELAVRQLGLEELKRLEARAEMADKVVAEKAKEAAGKAFHAFKKSDLDADGAVTMESLAWATDDRFASIENRERLYRAVETTKEWAENNYYHLPIARHTYELITENRFWLDYARHEGEAGFGSRHLGEAARSFHEMMLALAVLDLPFKAPDHETGIDGATLTFTAAGNALAFHREIKEAAMAQDRPPLLVSQSFFRRDDRFRMEDGEQVDKFVTEEFVTGIVYGGQVVVTNPTSSRQKLDVLVQIPKGAIPVLGQRATATQHLAMEPYSTQRLETWFYFPAAGRFPCYPAHVSKAGEVVAHADGFTFNVVETPSRVDEDSWAFISQWGTEDQVLDYLATRNLHAVELAKVAWRCRENADFLRKALAALDLRGLYDATLFSYGIHHDHAPAIRQFLLMQGGYLDSCGLYVKSDLITVDPIERRAYEHLEYKPLVNNRAHSSVGGARKILNDAIRGQYQRFMTILSQKPALDDVDNLSTTYHLFLQDRAQEAIDRLAMVGAEALPTRLQLDYFQAYAAFCNADPAAARAIAARHANHPVDRWRERFAAVIAQADEIEGKAPQVVDEQSREQQQAQLAAREPALELRIEGIQVNLTSQNIAEVQVNYYEMDLEFLFSTNPFVSSEGGGFSFIRPNRTETVQLAENRREHAFDLPREFQAKNVLVEVVGGGKKRSQAVYANELQTTLSENFGILTVRHARDGRALPRVYVKVYAMTGSGPQFYKDGYTDLRGKFDYATVSNTDIADATKFSVLVMSEDHGATVLEAPVPQR